jgi:hypothetical protein
VAVPEQVRKQSEAIQALYADLNTDAGAAAAAAEAEGAAGAEAGADSVVTEVQPAVTPESITAALAEAEQKYRSLQGMYNKDNAALRTASQRVQELEALIASFSAVTPTPAAPAAPVQVTDADRAEYGDTIDMMRKVTQSELHPLLTRLAAVETALGNLSTNLNTSVLPQVRQVAQQQAMSAEDRFWTTLSSDVPNWQQINNDPKFQSWLLQVDPLTGTTRQAFLEQAQQKLDVQRVVAFFRAFSPPAPAAAAATDTTQPSASELEKQIAPGRSRGGKPPVNPTTKQWTPAEAAKLYDDKRKGVYVGREAEFKKLEVDLFAAQAEGRYNATA